LWHPPAEENALAHYSVQSLVIDQSNNRLWAGTDAGLYSMCGGKWICFREANIHAIAFTPEGTMWLGTDKGLEEWPTPTDGAGLAGNPLAHFTATQSGLAADLVTALAVRAAGNRRQVWIGSPAGVSCYEYTL
jgi:ligand-binding sensor domain-containing protein